MTELLSNPSGIDQDPLIASPRAARLCGQSPATWRHKRMRSETPPYVKIGGRCYLAIQQNAGQIDYAAGDSNSTSIAN